MENKKKKGFTLIELLAIIVILAIIAVITVPIILNIIENSKKGAVIDSAYGYKDAINKYYVSELITRPDFRINGVYTIDEDGKLTRQSEEITIPVNGQKPNGGELVYENQKILSGCLTINGYKVIFNDNEVEGAEKGICYEQVTITFDQNYEGSEAITRSAKVDKELGQIIPDPERNHYGLIGWFTEKDGGTQIGATTKVTGATTYYAHWQAGSITVTLDPGLGTIENNTIPVTVGNTINSTINGTFKENIVPTRQGYEFLGWFTASDGGTEVNGTETLNDNVTYYAHWHKSSALTYTDSNNDGNISVGDWATIADEGFEVINPENENGNVLLLAQYNLKQQEDTSIVGYNQPSNGIMLMSNRTYLADSNLVWKQYNGAYDADDTYFITYFSDEQYWYGDICTASGDDDCYYREGGYLQDYSTDSEGYKYIYRTSNGNETENKLVTAINGYESYLKNQGVDIVDVRLMSYAEAYSLTENQRLANNQNYWLGSEDSHNDVHNSVWYVYSHGPLYDDDHGSLGDSYYLHGVRPVIEISQSEF